MWPMLLLACAGDVDPVRARPGNPLTDDGDSALIRDTADLDTADTGSDSALDTGPVDTAAPTEVCYLGLDRGGTTCVPVVPDDGTFGADYVYPAPYGGSATYAAPVRYLDLDTIDPALAVAPNFVLEELAAAYKGRWAVVQPRLVAHLQGLRDTIGGPLTVTSGYRNPAYNASVGGVTYSRHQYGDGADLEAGGYSVEALGDLCYGEGADYVGLYEDGHTHCDWRDGTPDPAFFPAFAGRPAAPAEHAEIAVDGAVLRAPAEGFDEGEPLRRWTAFAADGAALTTATGRSFVPPEGAARVRVVVGGRVEVEAVLPPRTPNSNIEGSR